MAQITQILQSDLRFSACICVPFQSVFSMYVPASR
jgi:hypothetical protein